MARSMSILLEFSRLEFEPNKAAFQFHIAQQFV